jgi:flagellar protein FliS
MTQNIHTAYLETQVMTATPQRLRLMLIEGAMRFANQTLQLWEQGDYDAALEPMDRCRAVVAELMASIKSDHSDVARAVLGNYLFIFRELTESTISKECDRLRGILNVLEIEQQTWQQVCVEMPDAPVPEVREQVNEITAGDLKAIPPVDLGGGGGGGGGFDSSASSTYGTPAPSMPHQGSPTSNTYPTPSSGGMSFEA